MHRLVKFDHNHSDPFVNTEEFFHVPCYLPVDQTSHPVLSFCEVPDSANKPASQFFKRSPVVLTSLRPITSYLMSKGSSNSTAKLPSLKRVHTLSVAKFKFQRWPVRTQRFLALSSVLLF